VSVSLRVSERGWGEEKRGREESWEMGEQRWSEEKDKKADKQKT
jgi:hypothetical protein